MYKRQGQEINIKYVLDLRDFPGDPVQEVLVHDYEIIANDPEVDIVVEVMGGIEPAYTFVKRALESGKSVCTSNKALVAKHGPELMEIAKEKNINFPVSYTHLDVYKRQIVSSGFCQNLKPSGNNLFIQYMKPVSYTHLDVYKRQIFFFLPKSI